MEISQGKKLPSFALLHPVPVPRSKNQAMASKAVATELILLYQTITNCETHQPSHFYLQNQHHGNRQQMNEKKNPRFIGHFIQHNHIP